MEEGAHGGKSAQGSRKSPCGLGAWIREPATPCKVDYPDLWPSLCLVPLETVFDRSIPASVRPQG